MNATTQQRTAGVLRWVNEVRAEHGKPTLAELPCGVPRTGRDCPLARALTYEDARCYVGKVDAIWYDTEPTLAGGVWSARYHRVALPTGMRAFVEDFDNGRLPDLVDA